MNEIKINQLGSTAAAAILTAAVLAGQYSYPARIEPYHIQQVGRTFSSVTERASEQRLSAEMFIQQVTEIFSSVARRQERLGREFEEAIFDDIEGLYET